VNRRRCSRGELSFFFVAMLSLISSLCAAQAGNGASNVAPGQGTQSMPFSISSSSFSNGGDIPKKFTCEDSDVSPDLRWTDPPAGTQSFALIVDDPDAPAGRWTHWVLFDLPGQATTLAEDRPKIEEIPGGGRQGRNDFRKIGYGGPCPPVGKPHRYFFKLYALDTKLNLKAGVSEAEVEQAMKGHVLAQAELMGKYKR